MARKCKRPKRTRRAGKRKTGRPTKKTKRLVAKIIRLIRAGNYAETAALSVGIAEETFYAWMRTDKAFSVLVKEATSHAEIEALADVAKGGPHWQARAWFLERRLPGKYSRQYRLPIPAAKEAHPHEDIEFDLPFADAEHVRAHVRAADENGGNGKPPEPKPDDPKQDPKPI